MNTSNPCNLTMSPRNHRWVHKQNRQSPIVLSIGTAAWSLSAMTGRLGWPMTSSIFPQTVWPHWGVRTVMVKARCSIEVVSGASGIFLKISAQNGSCEMPMCIFDCAGSHKMSVAEVSPAIFTVNFHTKWLLWDRPCNPLVALGLSDRSRCGAVLILRCLAQPFHHFGPVWSLSLWRGAHFHCQGDLVQRSWHGGLF